LNLLFLINSLDLSLSCALPLSGRVHGARQQHALCLCPGDKLLHISCPTDVPSPPVPRHIVAIEVAEAPGLPVPEDQYQERFWRRRLDGIGLDTVNKELLAIEFKRT
jgi:hypothetical protein